MSKRQTGCDGNDVNRVIPALPEDGGIETPDDEDGVLVTSATQRHERTARAEFDVHTAVIAGLASYLMRLNHAIAGRSVALSRVVADWADREDGAADSPSAAVYSTAIGTYAVNSGLAPGAPVKIEQDGSRHIALTCSGVYQIDDLTVDVRCEDKIQRAGVRHMLENGFSPVEWMSGFRLRLPRYHNAVATYLLVGAQEPDGPDMAGAGIRPLTMRLRARCEAYRVHSMALARPVATGSIDVTRRT